jgi:prevent-host-death family protein
LSHTHAPFLISASEHVFVAIGDSNCKGNVAELAIAKAAAELGIGVYKPLTEHGRCDLIFDIEGQLLRVQCKWANQKDDVISIRIGGSYHSPTRGYVLSTYSREEVDAVVAYCGANDTCYLLSIDEIEGLASVHMRLAPTRNGQFAGVRMASDYELGAVAQLVVAPVWHTGGRGFESPQLHTFPGDAEVVGAHEFRNRFGLFMQRASRGERFYVTRRGKPHVVLGPAEPSLLYNEGGENSTPEPSPEHE